VTVALSLSWVDGSHLRMDVSTRWEDYDQIAAISEHVGDTAEARIGSNCDARDLLVRDEPNIPRPGLPIAPGRGEHS
jgi:hypothetical protein